MFWTKFTWSDCAWYWTWYMDCILLQWSDKKTSRSPHHNVDEWWIPDAWICPSCETYWHSYSIFVFLDVCDGIFQEARNKHSTSELGRSNLDALWWRYLRSFGEIYILRPRVYCRMCQPRRSRILLRDSSRCKIFQRSSQSLEWDICMQINIQIQFHDYTSISLPGTSFERVQNKINNLISDGLLRVTKLYEFIPLLCIFEIAFQKDWTCYFGLRCYRSLGRQALR